jgi:hypothetical protein
MQTALDIVRHEIQPIDIAEVLDPAVAPGTRLSLALQSFSPDLLIVDLFWAPLPHIRPLLQCEAWLVVRSCPDIWLRGTRKMQFDPRQYSRLIGIEPVCNDQIREFIDPIVICNPDEARQRADVCRHWNIDDSKHIVAISHAGLRGEIATLRSGQTENTGSSDPSRSVIHADLHDKDAVFPLAPWLPGVDEVHCYAGYNGYWESRWMGYDKKTRFHVVNRRIDDPGLRLERGCDYAMKANGADMLARMIVG